MLIKCGFLLSILASALGARILGIATVPSYSHQVVFHSLWKELSLRGHQLTVLTTDPVKDSSLVNLTEIDTSFSYRYFDEGLGNIASTSFWRLTLQSLDRGPEWLEAQLSYSKVQNLVKNETEHFDLVIVEAIFPAMYAFAERFKCPFIGITSADSRARNYRVLGNPNHPILYVDFLITHSSIEYFWNRLERAFYSIYGNVLWEVITSYKQQELADKYIGTGYPSLREIERNMSMMFTNTDLIFHPIRALLPNVIQFGGGIHLGTSTPKPLPKNLQKQLNDAKKGFIYFSLGTNVKSKELPLETREIILQTFAELPYLILWKFELEDLPGKPDNVIVSKWFPQQAIFKHPNIKLFISQGGLQSMEEALYSNVPIVVVPFFGDQHRNMKTIVKNGMGLSADITKLNKENFKKPILEVLNNPRYKENVQKMVELARDQPMAGLEKAVWWTEYVLRHKGAKHLRSPALDIPIYQYYLLDIIASFLIVLFIIIFVTIKSVKFSKKVFRRVCGSKLKLS